MSKHEPPDLTVTVRTAIEFLHIELTSLADGRISVSVTATTVDDEEPQLINQEIATEHVATVEDALALIGKAMRATM